MDIDWTRILQAALSTVVTVGPTIAAQHWNGDGPDGKVNNAVQIIKDAAQAGATIEQNLAVSPAVQDAHSDIIKLATAAG